jgi:general secretion pathway protein J
MTQRTGRAQTQSQTSAAGFTLIEILVALLILGIMSALGYGTYRAARLSAERTEESLQRTREIEFGMRVIMQDFAEAVPRPVRDVLGNARIAAMQGAGGAGTVTPASDSSNLGSSGSSGNSSTSSGLTFNSGPSFGSGTNSTETPIVSLTRAGWSNTAGQQRSTLQRVSYALVDDVLKRSYQVNLDTVLGNKPVVQDILTRVKGVQLRYLDDNQTWQSQWPPGSTPVSDQARPVAVELVVEFKDWGRVRRIFEVAG